MYLYAFLIFVIAILIIIWYRDTKKVFKNQEMLTAQAIQPILNEFLKTQQAHQAQLAQSDLMNIFRVPKLRGLQGEKWLETLLGQVLPLKHFSLQHTFSTGVVCDAVVLLPDRKKLSIDSKFSLDNFLKMVNSTSENEIKSFEKEFHRDIKCRINEISKKYIIPEEGTTEFAFMFVPSEGVYYRTFIETDNELLDYAFQQKVIVVSPNTLYIYLQFVLHGLKGNEIEKNARQLQQTLDGIILNLSAFNKEYSKIKEKLDQAQNNFAKSNKLLDSAQEGLKRISELSL